MNVENTIQPADHTDDPEVAFEAMSRRLAGLTAAVEGFAARQQELHSRDYGPDLAKIHSLSGEMVAAINKLAAKPGVALTPETLAPQIAKAGEGVRAADHQAWARANRELGAAIQSLNDVTASAMKADTQRHWIIGAAITALVMGFAFGMIVPTRIAQSVPESWHWPEQRAARLLQRSEWDAGMRLLQVADPHQLRALNVAARMVEDNAEALAGCRTRAAQSKNAVKCHIEVAAATAD
ncbi:hypothetical protein M2337_001722 [Sphingobium sp. B2D3A]|uniref:DUF6118 family protein n=1 Tax=unclassified Sphingobium TaxID=2611147 RepID=UPI00222498DD|nr:MULTISPECIES: DUF6118 family protein [unclassified Sphingobium]MCW2337489.1 hypothetical protein [Sphingobium sp. B2D3A]MCW2383947.1 hypothetical protein [Sphingobium sp. B2D3D]